MPLNHHAPMTFTCCPTINSVFMLTFYIHVYVDCQIHQKPHVDTYSKVKGWN